MRSRTTVVGSVAVLVLALVLVALGMAAPPPPPGPPGPPGPPPPAMNLTVGACPHSNYATIQAAVDAAAPGAKITVCPGTYVEQVTIPAGKDNLTLQSQNPLTAIIEAPATMTSSKTVVEITGSHNVDLAKFTIEGPGSTGCDSLEYGVKVDGGASA